MYAKMKFVVVSLFTGMLIAAATAAVIGKRQSSACGAADIAELNSIRERFQNCRAALPCAGNESGCACCSRLDADGGTCCDEYSSGVALYNQCRNSGALDDMRRQTDFVELARLATQLFEGCRALIELASDGDGAASLYLTTATVAMCAALFSSAKLLL